MLLDMRPLDVLSADTLATWCEELTHWKRPWCWGRLRAGGEGDDGGWDGWVASPTQWTWVWVSSGSWWWTGITVTKSQTGLSDWTELLIVIVREIKLASMTCNQTIHKSTILLDFRDLKTTIFIQTVNRHLKRCSTSLISDTYKSILQWGATSHWSEQPSSKSLQVTNAGEGVEKREPSYPIGGNVSWHHNYGKGYGGSLES